MTQQKSEHRRGAQASGNRGPTRGVESLGGAKAVPVEQQMRQLGWLLGTAEEAASAAADGRVARVLSLATTRAAPKPRSREKTVASATMEEVCERLLAAFEHVAANRPAPGPDRQRIEQVRVHLPALLPAFRSLRRRNIYVPSERAGHRVMESVTRLITHQLELKINQAKSAVARSQARTFLGFSFSAGPRASV